jgi:hypothetical protein
MKYGIEVMRLFMVEGEHVSCQVKFSRKKGRAYVEILLVVPNLVLRNK